MGAAAPSQRVARRLLGAATLLIALTVGLLFDAGGAGADDDPCEKDCTTETTDETTTTTEATTTTTSAATTSTTRPTTSTTSGSGGGFIRPDTTTTTSTTAAPGATTTTTTATAGGQSTETTTTTMFIYAGPVAPSSEPSATTPGPAPYFGPFATPFRGLAPFLGLPPATPESSIPVLPPFLSASARSAGRAASADIAIAELERAPRRSAARTVIFLLVAALLVVAALVVMVGPRWLWRQVTRRDF